MTKIIIGAALGYAGYMFWTKYNKTKTVMTTTDVQNYSAPGGGGGMYLDPNTMMAGMGNYRWRRWQR
jgi:hypothetical protein